MWRKRLTKLGGSIALVFPPKLLRKLDISVGGEVDIFCRGNEIIIRSATNEGVEKLLATIDTKDLLDEITRRGEI